MSFRKFDLLIENKLTDTQISELVIDAENNPFLKEALDSYVTRHILDDTKEITPQIELLAKPFVWHKQVVAKNSDHAAGAAPVAPKPDVSSGIGTVIRIAATGVAAVSAVMLLFFFTDAYINKQTNVVGQIKNNTANVSHTAKLQNVTDTSQTVILPVKKQTQAPSSNKDEPDQPQVNEPIIPDEYAYIQKANNESSIGKDFLNQLLTLNEILYIDNNVLAEINAREPLQLFSLTPSEGRTVIGITGKKNIYLKAQSQDEIDGLINKYSKEKVTALSSTAKYTISNSYSNIVTLNGLAINTSQKDHEDTMSYKIIFKIQDVPGNLKDSVIYFYVGKQ